MDENDNIYHLIWVMIELENKGGWNWFMGRLINDLVETRDTKWIFINDRQKICIY